MATFVLVHPAWLGGWCWRKVTPILRAGGHEVHTPTLTGLGERAHLATPEVGLDIHATDVVSLIELEDLDDVVLVGNSSGGMVITAVADRIPERLTTVVYLDAFVPTPGASLVDLLAPDRRATFQAMIDGEGAGWLMPRFAPPPWEVIVRDLWQVTEPDDQAWMLPRLRPTPARHFTDSFSPTRPDAEPLRRAYVRCPAFPHPGFDRFAELARSSPSWDLVELAASHVSYVTHPEALSDVLVGLAP